MDPTSPPVGRDAVVAALVDAASEEFAQKGFEGTRIRAVAARAGVNHGLVHRHFGSKAALLDAVLDHLADAVADDLSAHGGVEAIGGLATRRFLRVLARAVLDGADVGGRAHHPVMDRATAQLVGATGRAEADVRVAVAQAMALELGWLLFEPFLVSAAGLTSDQVGPARDSIRGAQRTLTGLEPTS